MKIKIRSRKTLFIILGIIIFSTFLSSKTVTFPGLSNPNDIKADDNCLYIADGTSVFIFDIKSFKLKKKFGKPGEGPGEFQGSLTSGRAPLELDILKDRILVNSFGKLSFFTKEGKLIKEIKISDTSRRFIRFGKGFAGEINKRIDNIRYRVLYLYDQTLHKTRILFKRPHSLQGMGGGFNPYEGPRYIARYNDKLFVCWEPGFKIRVYDKTGKHIYSITYDYKQRKISSSDKKRVDNYLKNHPRLKEMYNLLKPFKFPQYFPALSGMIISDGKVYVISTKYAKNGMECFTFDPEGKLLKRQFLNLKTPDEFSMYPFVIRGGKSYQLVEVEDSEEWQLVVTELN